MTQPLSLEFFFQAAPHRGKSQTLGGGWSPSSGARIWWYLGSLSESQSFFCGVELRCASTRTGEHRWTRNPVPALRERQRQFLTAATPICRRVPQVSSRSQSMLWNFPRLESINLRLAVIPPQSRTQQELSHLSAVGRSTA